MTTTVEIATPVVDAVRAAIVARDYGISLAESSELAALNKDLIDQAIDAFAASGQEFSANDLRHLLPDDVPGPLFGARFLAGRSRGVIRPVGWVTSTKKNTHAKPVARWVGTGTDPGASA